MSGQEEGARPAAAGLRSVTDAPVTWARVALGRAVRTVLAGDPQPAPATALRGDDAGLFGPGSVTWRVHADISVLVGGLTSLMVQALHPLAMAAVADHSTFREDLVGRVQRTGQFIGATTYGSTADAEAAIDHVREVHGWVRGTAPDGRPYSADDPHLLRWIHVAEVWSFLNAFQRYGDGQLSRTDADRYVAEMAEVGHRLGADDLPRTFGGLQLALESFRPELQATAQSREAIYRLFLAPVPLPARGFYTVLLAASVGLLPRWARRMHWLPSVPLADPLVVRPAATAMLRLLGWALAAESPVREPNAA